MHTSPVTELLAEKVTGRSWGLPFLLGSSMVYVQYDVSENAIASSPYRGPTDPTSPPRDLRRVLAFTLRDSFLPCPALEPPGTLYALSN